MLLILLAAAAAVSSQTGTGLDNLPSDPTRAWAVIIVVALMALSPIIVAKVRPSRHAIDAPPTQSVVIGGSVTPHIDASQALLATVVGNLEERARQAEAKFDELDRRHMKLVRDVARSELQVEMLEDRVRELEAENNVLTGRLRERP